MIDWTFVEDQPPLDCALEYLVCTVSGNIHIAEYHDDPKGFWGNCGQIYDVVAYILLFKIPRPMRTIITNEEAALALLKMKKNDY